MRVHTFLNQSTCLLRTFLRQVLFSPVSLRITKILCPQSRTSTPIPARLTQPAQTSTDIFVYLWKVGKYNSFSDNLPPQQITFPFTLAGSRGISTFFPPHCLNWLHKPHNFDHSLAIRALKDVYVF
jgi:hypothetical protein